MLPPLSEHTAYETSLGCQHCFAKELCGGLYTRGTLDCLCLTCNNPDKCTYLCPRSKNFVATWRDTGGINVKVEELYQRPDALPPYVPLIQHGSKRTTPLPAVIVALTTFDVTRRDKKINDMVRDQDALRDKFRLARNTSIVLSSIAPDNELEAYWRERKHRQLVEGIKAIRPAHVIAPNFSLFRDVPRFDNLANIKRSLVCAEEFSKAGLSVIPYVAGITEHDWQRWADFLKEHKRITMVCKEFQTGGKKKIVGDWHIGRLLELQERLGRRLHVVAIAGRRHRALQQQTWSVSVIDSMPFMRTMHRQRLTSNGWEETTTPAGVPLDDLLSHNITAYTNSVGKLRQRTLPPMRAPISITHAPIQLVLWPQPTGEPQPTAA
jgi:hypothetical protein